MNLLSRLSNEHYDILMQEHEVYPLTTEKIVNELTNLNYWCELKFSTVNHLVYKLGLPNHEPTTIQNIFKNESIEH